MTYAIEIFLPLATSAERVKEITEFVESSGGRLDFREPAGVNGEATCLTFEFDNLPAAEATATSIREHGEHTEGPFAYGDGRLSDHDQGKE